MNQKKLNEDLFLAAIWGSASDIHRLVKRGANINAVDSEQNTPLIAAAESGNVGTVTIAYYGGLYKSQEHIRKNS